MQTPSVSQHLDQISSDASQLLPNAKRRKMSSSPNVMSDTSDIPKFKLCSFSLGSTEGTGSEGNSTAIVVGEERQEHCEQQGVGQVSATMAVDFSPAAEQHQLVMTEQREEQAKRKPDKIGKMIRMESIWLKYPYVIPKQKRRGKDWKTDASEYNSKPFRLAGIDIQKSFFTELVDPTSYLLDEHIEVGVYFLRKKYCYHLPSYPKSRYAITNLIFDQYITKLASVHTSDKQKEKIRIRNEKRMEEKNK
ncbi:uncharacterized protein [Nicotiana tomentosiformis]|uniref:uncharacterized protein n=1 Tax=Nicotiana tomentosiformis TaxID=4098 RepID=UPI0008789E9F